MVKIFWGEPSSVFVKRERAAEPAPDGTPSRVER
jgi:hypothetical protein